MIRGIRVTLICSEKMPPSKLESIVSIFPKIATLNLHTATQLKPQDIPIILGSAQELTNLTIPTNYSEVMLKVFTIFTIIFLLFMAAEL